MLGVDGHDLAAPGGAGLGDDRAGGDETLLVRQRQALAGFESSNRRRQPGEADDAVQHDVGVGVGGELRERVGMIGADAGAVLGNAERGRLLGEQFAVRAGSEGDHSVVVTVTADDVECLGAD